ncbi:MAG TPA: hypothetical protein VLT86_05005 [Vicinamibacterales bacterium]|nr:hypothetical protein [Vicinamibacterales bacterium]
MRSRHALVAALLGGCLWAASPARAQNPAPKPPAEPPLRRWFDLQTFTVYTRYRFIESSRSVTTSDQLQYKDAFRGRVNLDAHKRYTINFGYFSGTSFVSSWNNWGVGNNTTFDGTNSLKQLYASAAPVTGLEIQYGGIYINRGEADEFTTYDDDGYLMGERVSVRRPQDLYLDEITVTRAGIGPVGSPKVSDRWNGLTNANYTQVLGLKHFGKTVAGSVEYNRQTGADILRAAVTVHLQKTALVRTIRYEQYCRVNDRAANGFGVWADRSVTGRATIQGGYVTVDQYYGGWNADRMLIGRRVFAIGTVQLYGPISASVYATKAFAGSYTVPIGRRFDAVISYDVLNTLRRSGLF